MPGDARVRAANLFGAIALETAHLQENATAAVIGQTGAASAALVVIAASPGRSVEELRAALGLSQPGAARLCNRLAQEGWIDQGASPGRRGFAVTLTAAGNRKLRDLLKARRAALLDILAPLDDNALEILISVLEPVLASRTSGRPALERLCRMCERTACINCPVGSALDGMISSADNDEPGRGDR